MIRALLLHRRCCLGSLSVASLRRFEPAKDRVAPSSIGPARFRLSVSTSLRVLAILLFAAIVGFTAVRIQQLRGAVVDNAREQLSRLDMVFAEQTGRAVETIDFIMRGIAEQHAAHDPQLTADTLRRRIIGVRQVMALALTDAEGQILLSSWDGPDNQTPATLPPAGLTLLHDLSAKPDAGLLISEPLRDADGRWTALMARRLPGADFTGLIVGYINLAYFEDFYKAVDLSNNGAIVLHRRDGTVLARYPHDEKVVGTSFAELPPFKEVLAHDIAGVVEMTSPVDGSLRLLAIRALRAFPLAVNISVQYDEVLASWRRQATWLLVAVTTVGLLITALLFQLARRSRDVEQLVASYAAAQAAAKAANKDLLVQMEERKRAEFALQLAQRVEAVGQLTGGVAHDFNNLLTVIIGNTELMQNNPGSAPFSTWLGAIRAAAQRGADLTGQLLAFSRRQPLAPRSVDLNAQITTMRPLLESAIGTKVALRFTLQTGLPPALVDPTQFELVVLNLAINARDAMPHGGTLEIATDTTELQTESPPGRYASVRVRDDGAGMTAFVLERAFEPFFSTKAVRGGSGLGLSQVWNVARQSGGRARIESVEGVGTMVEVLLPLADPAAAASVS